MASHKDSHQSYGLGSSNSRSSTSGKYGVFTERLLPNGNRVKVMNNSIFTKAVNTASKVRHDK